MKTKLRFITPGGIVSPGELRRIAGAAQYFGVQHLHIGNRQDLLLKVEKDSVREFGKRLDHCLYHFTFDREDSKNIMTSFAVRNIFATTTWVTEGVYLEILSTFNHQPKLKINIVDPLQSFVPLFSGDLNFIASHQEDYWFLFIRLPKENKMEMWPVLVDSKEVHLLSQTIEQFLIRNINFNMIQLQTHIYNTRNWSFRIIDKNLVIKPSRFPNYEGFQPMGERYWLGIYHRENSFDINFVESLCALCSLTNIGSINLTSWNSFLIKNIDEKDIPLWENLLGKYGVNTGHSQLELNWHTPELNKKIERVKKYVFRAFEKRGLRTAGLTFGITYTNEDLPVSILIRRKVQLRIGPFEYFKSYSVRYKKDFDPNSQEIISFADGLKRRNLPNILMYLTSLYYEHLNRYSQLPETSASINISKETVSAQNTHVVYQCGSCMTIYDPAYGDQSVSVSQGTAFEDLPAEYKCPVCEAPKAAFSPIKMDLLIAKS